VFSDLIHLTCDAIETPEKDLQPYMDLILKSTPPIVSDSPAESDEETVPTILWSFFFKIPKCTNCDRPAGSMLKSGLKMCCGPRFELDYDLAIAQAKLIFENLYANEEFLPRAPDPDEIIFGDETEDVDKAAVNLEASAGETDASGFAVDSKDDGDKLE
jgi:Rab proteins geranylgeranyltransferase component A